MYNLKLLQPIVYAYQSFVMHSYMHNPIIVVIILLLDISCFHVIVFYVNVLDSW